MLRYFPVKSCQPFELVQARMVEEEAGSCEMLYQLFISAERNEG